MQSAPSIVRDGAHLAHAVAEHRHAGLSTIALFRGLRFGDRLAHAVDRRRPYGAFIIPGLIMLSLLTESISNASFGIYMPRYSGTIYEAAVGTGGLPGGGDRLCRRRGDQVDHSRPGDPSHGALVRRLRDRSSLCDGCCFWC
jgi:hypothetical protein